MEQPSSPSLPNVYSLLHCGKYAPVQLLRSTDPIKFNRISPQLKMKSSWTSDFFCPYVTSYFAAGFTFCKMCKFLQVYRMYIITTTGKHFILINFVFIYFYLFRNLINFYKQQLNFTVCTTP